MIQKESGLEASQRWNRPEAARLAAAKNMKPAIRSVGISTAYTLNAIRKTANKPTVSARMRKRAERFRVHKPSASTLILKYGITIKAIKTSVGINTPATTGGK